jgi:class 3 adenylate cyclase
MVEVPKSRYARSSDGNLIAYHEIGDGAVDVLVIAPSFIPIDLLFDEPRALQFLDRLSSFSRHIWFDPRGTGASGGIVPTEDRLLETWLEDMIAVADDACLERVAVLQLGGAGQGPFFASTHPERTAALVLVNTFAHARRAEDYPHGFTDEELDSLLGFTPDGFFSIELMAPSLVDDVRFRRWYDRALRLGAPPDVRRRRAVAAFESDARGVLGSVQTPSLVVSRGGHGVSDQRHYLADHMAGSRLVELEGRDPLFFVDSGRLLDVIEEFLTGRHASPEPDRVLATVLFTDLVASTTRVTEIGDRHWRHLLETHDALVRSELDRFRGREIKSTGDGVLATFDGPGRAIRCACAIRDALGALGLEVRAGLHTGEIELRGDDVAGIAVVIAQRISAHAGAGDVLVSRTVADLIAGSGIELRDQGELPLKGMPGTWQIYRVTSSP